MFLTLTEVTGLIYKHAELPAPAVVGYPSHLSYHPDGKLAFSATLLDGDVLEAGLSFHLRVPSSFVPNIPAGTFVDSERDSVSEDFLYPGMSVIELNRYPSRSSYRSRVRQLCIALGKHLKFLRS
jgi:hypothetical protein